MSIKELFPTLFVITVIIICQLFGIKLDMTTFVISFVTGVLSVLIPYHNDLIK
jgi:hypothetical protein